MSTDRAELFRAANPWPTVDEMPEEYTCHCGLYVHPTRYNREALHIPDCPFHALTVWDRARTP